jgi:hypothetical protein
MISGEGGWEESKDPILISVMVVVVRFPFSWKDSVETMPKASVCPTHLTPGLTPVLAWRAKSLTYVVALPARIFLTHPAIIIIITFASPQNAIDDL